MNARPIALLLLSLTAVSGASAQMSTVKIAGATPAECSKNLADWRTKEVAPSLEAYRNATPENKAAATTTYSKALSAAAAQVEPLARSCAAKFDVATIAPGNLMDLITLLGTAKDTTNGRRATERLLSATDLPPRARAQALTIGMNQEVAKASTVFGILPGAEKYVAQLDMLPDSLDDMKLAAHRSMLGRYEYLDVADGLRTHATAVIALARKLDKPADMISGYSSLSRSYADRLHPDSALMILDKAEKELGAPATARFKDFRDRYALIGTKAQQITADWWINTPAKSVNSPALGKVTLIEFTAHWCGPCKNSYPGLQSVAAHFKGQAFEGAMVTSLYGYVGTQQNLSPEQEVAADRIYFGEEHKVPFPVAINAPIKPAPVTVPSSGTNNGAPILPARLVPKPDADYRVGGIPQIMIVDKKGVIRQIVTGWDQGNTARFTAYIEMLLAEKN